MRHVGIVFLAHLLLATPRAYAVGFNRTSYSIVKPAEAAFQENHAASELARYVRMMTGRTPSIVSDKAIADRLPGTLCFIIGSPDRNTLTADLVAKGHLGSIVSLPEHPDGFVVLTDKLPDGPNVILLAGRRPIGSLYAVYDYLETACRVGFFQDGEHVPRLKKLPDDEIVRIEQPRFDSRLHLAWNAHRGIKKYHSYWWSLEDWQRELDWMAKQRLNLCRLDMWHYGRFAGDAFVQAFPEIGPEPEGRLYPFMAGWPIEYGWPPEHRRKVVQQLFEYGRKLGIRFVWSLSYGTVPFRFKDLHPEYEYLPADQYGKSRNISPFDPGAYEVEKKFLLKLIELFGSDHLYMYSPYAEIDVGQGDIEKNLQMRIQAGKQILKLIAEVDPQGTWVSDTWDMVDSSHRWNPDLVKRYMDSFPTDKMYLYETAAEVQPLYRKYDWWHGKPWAFGVLHSFAGKDTLHGNPEELIERVQDAATSPMCTGLFMVPEATHHNVMFWDLVTHLAWQPAGITFDDFLQDYVQRRYDQRSAGPLYEAWQEIAAACYPSPAPSLFTHVYSQKPWYQWKGDCPLFSGRESQVDARQMEIAEELPRLSRALKLLLSQRRRQKNNPVYAEDVVVVFREYARRCFEQAAGDACLAFAAGDKAAFAQHRADAVEILDLLAGVLGQCPSYSINKTIAEACSVPGHNPLIPEMTRQACLNAGGYTAEDVYEQFMGQYIPETRAYFDLLTAKLDRGEARVQRSELDAAFERITTTYRDLGWTGTVARAVSPVTAVAACWQRPCFRDTARRAAARQAALMTPTKDYGTGGVFADNFSAYTDGDAGSPVWQVLAGEWQVQDGQYHACRTDGYDFCAMAHAHLAARYRLEVRLRLVEGLLEGGLLFNGRSPSSKANSQLVRFSGPGTLWCGPFDRSGAFTLADTLTTGIDPASDEWITLAVTVQNDKGTYDVAINGKPVAEGLKLARAPKGEYTRYAGLMSCRGHIAFDDLKITPLATRLR